MRAAHCLVALLTASGASLPSGATEPAAHAVGARLPFDEYEAEDGRWTGEQIGPDRRPGTLASEASGRRAVLLGRPGDRIDFRLRHAANALTVRAAIPDSPDGRGRDGSLAVIVGGRVAARLPLTSRYGWYYGKYPFTNDPRDGAPHHFFDETRTLLPRILPAGTVVELRRDDENGAPWVAVDLADAELVPPASAPPPGALSIIGFGADPSGRRPSADAFDRAIAAARAAGAPVWLPPGSYRIDRHIAVDRVRILGAGPWRTTLRGDGVGLYGNPAPHASTGVELGGFSIVGEVDRRRDDEQLNGIGGAMGGGTILHDLFIQHVKAGLWFDGPMDGIRISRLRVSDTAADGLNLHRGVSHATVEDSLFRNTGDDGLAAWSQGAANHHVQFIHDTVVAPLLANGIAFYGGHDLVAADDLVADTVTEGGGLHLGNRFEAVPASGRIEFARDIVLRASGHDPNWRSGVGALWLYALDHPIDADVRVVDVSLIDSGAAAVQLLGRPVASVTFVGLRVDGAAGPALQTQAQGAASLGPASIRRAGRPLWRRCVPGFTVRGSSRLLGSPSRLGCPS